MLTITKGGGKHIFEFIIERMYMRMQKIKIHKLGPIIDCEISIEKFMVLTGPQASGKSTLAKSIFFFKNIKNLLLMLCRKRNLLDDTETLKMSYKKRIIREIRSNFLQIFGSTWGMNNEMVMHYEFTQSRWITISLKNDKMNPNYIWVDLSDEIKKFLYELDTIDEMGSWLEQDTWLKTEIENFFGDTREIVYIPAGRSLITLLSSQLSYIYSSMDDAQKRALDYCTQNYLERILRLKGDYTTSYVQMIQNQMQLTDKKVDKKYLLSVITLMQDILKGEYRNVNGEERLQVTESQYVKINFASSGQQEVVWILNVLFYQLLYNRKAYFIIEEPESHLFPDAQKKIVQFISAVKNNGNQILVTTHSPYILGELNNLLYANHICGQVKEEELSQIISEYQRIEYSDFTAYFLQGGEVESCLDEEFPSIKNEIIDGAADDINREFDEMVAMSTSNL